MYHSERSYSTLLTAIITRERMQQSGLLRSTDASLLRRHVASTAHKKNVFVFRWVESIKDLIDV